jgi:hypothetical protein
MTDPRRRGGERRSNARAKPQEGKRERESIRKQEALPKISPKIIIRV